MFGSADLMMGANHIRVRCFDGVTRMGRIKGTIKKRVWIREGDIRIVIPVELSGREVRYRVPVYRAAGRMAETE